LEVLSSQTTYTFSLVAKNASGSSTAVTASATTKTATIQTSPTITYTSLNYYDLSAAFAGYNKLVSPKSNPNIIYATYYNTGSYAAYPRIFYSQDGGATFSYTTIGPRLNWNSTNSFDVNKPETATADVCCSDDGKYVYIQTNQRYINASSNYGTTFYANTSPYVNNTILFGTSTIPTGEALITSGQAVQPYGANTQNIVHWSNNANSTYGFKAVSNTYSTAAINASMNTVYYSNGSNILYYYNAGTKANLLSFNFTSTTFSTATFSPSNGSKLWAMVSGGGLTFVFSASSNKLYKSINGTTFTNVPAFSSGGIAANFNVTYNSWIIMEPYVGFVMVGVGSQILYSKDSGVNWTNLTSPTIPSITGGSAASCVLQDSNVVVYLMTHDTLSGDYKRFQFYKLYFPVNIA
jgi:hypothetical protein